VDLLIAASIAAPSIIGARAGVVIAQRLSSEVLALIFNGMSVILIPTHFFVQQYREQNPHQKTNEQSHEKEIKTVSATSLSSFSLSSLAPPPPIYLQHATYGVCAGVLSALMGVGGAPLTMSYVSTIQHSCFLKL
jgi:uncharacterized membrane protein YfcA